MEVIFSHFAKTMMLTMITECKIIVPNVTQHCTPQKCHIQVPRTWVLLVSLLWSRIFFWVWVLKITEIVGRDFDA